MSQETVVEMESRDEQGNALKVKIEGKTEMPFWKHDLKLEAVKALLETVDKKDFYEADKQEEFHKLIEDIQKTLDFISE